MIKRLAIIGVGLIGGSFARALRAAQAVEKIIGSGRSQENLRKALELNVIDQIASDPAQAARDADVIFIAVPLGAMREIFTALRGQIKTDAIVTDGGSVKGSVVAAAQNVFGTCPPWLVLGHPIAGTEHSGVEASFAELYQKRRVILTPMPETDPSALAKITELWKLCGAEVTKMSVEHHDEILAATSHLPHLLAFGLVDALARMRENDEIFRYAAGGFRDFTRIASSSPEMWRDICVANREAISILLSNFSNELIELAALIRNADEKNLFELFTRAKTARDRFYIPGDP